ncbi:MAG: hypothetical protein WCP69_10925 [Bacteroidota bacterium]
MKLKKYKFINQLIRKLVPMVVMMLICSTIWAQSPQKLSYQAVIRNSSNQLVTNTQIGMQISILQGSATGTVVYTEVKTPTTNGNGLVTIEIGGGVGFDTINWANGQYFIETKTAVTPPLTTYTITGSSQLLSVPYALYAKTSGSSIPGPQGATGAIGPQGNAGAQGIQGIPGATGAQGETGAIGAMGPTGVQGSTGEQGLQGLIGNTGAQGIPGVTGAVGATGSQGIPGNTGSIGAVGPTGSQGIQGLIGNTGAQGIPGVTGAVGATGSQGIQGNTGSIGAVGPTGAQGIQGIPGNTGAMGATGSQGVQGNTGSTGAQGGVINADWNAVSGTAQILNKPTTILGYGITDAFTGNYNFLSNLPTLFSGSYTDLTNRPVDATTVASGFMSSTDKTKLNGIATGAEVNVQADWNQATSTADDYIKNKPTIQNSQWTTSGSGIYYNTGKVSIGTINSTFPLEVSVPSSSGSQINLKLTNLTLGIGNGVGILFAPDDAAIAKMGIVVERREAWGLSTMHFLSRTSHDYVSADLSNSVMSITSNGYVGMGTTTPSVRLDVVGVINATGGNSNNWNTAYGWGNHSTAGYLTSYTETDPVFLAKFDVTGSSTGDLLKFNGTKFVKFTPNYLTSYTETDPAWTTASANYYTKTNMQTSGSSQLHFGNITNKPTTILGYGITDAFNGNYNSLSNLPTLFSGSYTDLTNRPVDATTVASGFMSSTDKTKLNGIATGAEVNVQADWNQATSTADDYIKNKPTIQNSQWTTSGSGIYYNTGKVSIGTINSTFPLEVSVPSSSGSQINLKLTNLTLGIGNGVGILFAPDDAAIAKMGIVVERREAWGLSTMHFLSRTSHDYVSADLSNSVMSITSNGYVGMGTTTPSVRLDVVGVINATGGNSNNWNTAYGWGNHSTAGYLTNYTETDPVYASKYNVITPSNGQLLRYNSVSAKWENWTPNYLDADQGGNSGKFLTTNGSIPSWSLITKTTVGLGNVENTALSTWAGSANINTLGAITSGTWQGTAINSSYVDILPASKISSGIFDNNRINWASPGTIGFTTRSSGAFTSLAANNGLTVSNGTVNIKPSGSSGTSGQVLTTDGAGNATWQNAPTFSRPTRIVNSSVTLTAADEMVIVNGAYDVTLPASPTNGQLLMISSSNSSGTVITNGASLLIMSTPYSGMYTFADLGALVILVYNSTGNVWCKAGI